MPIRKSIISLRQFSGSNPRGKWMRFSFAAAWDKASSSYDSLRQTDPVYSSCIRQSVRQIPTGTGLCLDAGCGTGLPTITLSARCNTVVAVDLSRDSLKVLKEKSLSNVIVIQADLNSLPFKNSVFDCCVCANALQHLRPGGPQERTVAELARVTKEEGILSVSVHHYSKSKRRAGWVKEGKPGQAGVDYIFRFTRDELLTLFPESVIKGVGYYKILWIPFFGSRLQNVLANFFGTLAALLGYGHMLVAVANKGKASPTGNQGKTPQSL